MIEETALYSDLERAIAKLARHRFVVKNKRGLIMDTDTVFAGDTIIFDRDRFEHGEVF